MGVSGGECVELGGIGLGIGLGLVLGVGLGVGLGFGVDGSPAVEVAVEAEHGFGGGDAGGELFTAQALTQNPEGEELVVGAGVREVGGW